jgi:hypothetical protein
LHPYKRYVVNDLRENLGSHRRADPPVDALCGENPYAPKKRPGE